MPVNNDLIAAALVQLASIMAANWILTEALGKRLGLPKFWLSLGVAPALTMAAYGLGWFTALPASATLASVPIAGARAYLSAAFAGVIAALLTSAAHAAMVGTKGDGTE
jgi:hypothetical protein